MAIRRSKLLLASAGVILLALLFQQSREGTSSPAAAGQNPATTTDAGISPANYDKDRSKTRRPAKDIRAQADRWYAKILEDNPDMAVTYRDIPDDRNGFLQLLEFMERQGKDGLPIPPEIRGIVDGSAPWDPVAFARWQEENQALIQEILSIGMLPDQSTRGIDPQRFSFIAARTPRDAAILLQACARLAMEQGDEAVAFTNLNAALGLADHLDRMEVPSLLAETVSVLIRLSTRKIVMKQLLSGEGGVSGDLSIWADLIGSGPESPEALAHVLKGEWHTTTRSYLLPGLLGDGSVLPGDASKIRDPDAVAQTYLDYFRHLTTQLDAPELKDIASINMGPPDMSHLSPEAAEYFAVIFPGVTSWSKGWARAQTDAALVQAAFIAAAGNEMPREPITGLPFIHDPATGTVRVPDDPSLKSHNFEPVKVPVSQVRKP